MNEKLRNFLLSLCVFALSIAMLEGVTRAFVYETPWHQSLADAVTAEPVRNYIRNAQGLRDVEIRPFKSPSEKRVLFLGDSFTFGQGVFSDDAVFPALLEKRLDAEKPIPGTQHIDILNGGIPGSLTHQWVRLLGRVGGVYKPDLIVVVFFLRDGTRTSSMGGFFGPIREKIVKANNRSRLYQSLYLYRLWKDFQDKQGDF